jgi:hypothetical protein
MGVPLPFLPVHSEDKAKLFVCLVLVINGALNTDCMALECYKFVDGKTIFPKLPVYLPAYLDGYLCNMRVQYAVSGTDGNIELLELLELLEQLHKTCSGRFDGTRPSK